MYIANTLLFITRFKDLIYGFRIERGVFTLESD